MRDHLEKKHAGDPVTSDTDSVHSYICQTLTMCMIAYDFTDARKLGDGERIMRLVKFMLLYFKALGKPKYLYKCLRLLAQVKCFLTPREATNIIWNRFSNTKGSQDRNVELDRECEHSNLNFKIFARGLHGQVNQDTVDRISRSCQPIARALHSVDKESGIIVYGSGSRYVDHVEDVTKLVDQLKGEHLFGIQEGRYHKCFPGFTNGFKVDHNYLYMYVWMTKS